MLQFQSPQNIQEVDPATTDKKHVLRIEALDVTNDILEVLDAHSYFA